MDILTYMHTHLTMDDLLPTYIHVHIYSFAPISRSHFIVSEHNKQHKGGGELEVGVKFLTTRLSIFLAPFIYVLFFFS